MGAESSLLEGKGGQHPSYCVGLHPSQITLDLSSSCIFQFSFSLPPPPFLDVNLAFPPGSADTLVLTEGAGLDEIIIFTLAFKKSGFSG